MTPVKQINDDEMPYMRKAKKQMSIDELYNQPLHIKIRGKLAEKGLTQQDVLKYMESKGHKYSKATVSYWINGKYTPSLEALCLLADYLEVTVDWLVRTNPWQEMQNKKQALLDYGGPYLTALYLKTSLLTEEGENKVLEYADLLLHVQDYVLPQFQGDYDERIAYLIEEYKKLFNTRADLELKELKDAYDNTEH